MEAELLPWKQRPAGPTLHPSPQQSLCWALPSGRRKTKNLWLRAHIQPEALSMTTQASSSFSLPAGQPCPILSWPLSHSAPANPRLLVGSQVHPTAVRLPPTFRTCSPFLIPSFLLSLVTTDSHFKIQVNHYLCREDLLAFLCPLVPRGYHVPTFCENLPFKIIIFCLFLCLSPLFP